ncbi:MAG: DUF4426 domain-containing protein [Thiotrichales bacterium]
MKSLRLPRRIAFAAAICAFGTTVALADEQKFGHYTLHYSAFNADFLSPQIAQAYGIQRSKNRGVLNVTLTEQSANALPKPVEAELSATAINVYQQVKPIKLRKLEDAGAVYYVAEFPVADQELLNFQITAHRSGSEIGTVKFQKQFFTK